MEKKCTHDYYRSIVILSSTVEEAREERSE